MTTLRPLTEDGFGAKKVAVIGPDGKPMRNDAGKIVYRALGREAQTISMRFATAGSPARTGIWRLPVSISASMAAPLKSRASNSTPTIHLGVGTKAIERKAEQADARRRHGRRTRTHRAAGSSAARRMPGASSAVRRSCSTSITREKSVFDERDVAKVLHRYIDDAGSVPEPDGAHPAEPGSAPARTRADRLCDRYPDAAKYTTREMIRLEAEMASRAIWLSGRASHGVREAVLTGDLCAPFPTVG